jgi:hypothetical protein
MDDDQLDMKTAQTREFSRCSSFQAKSAPSAIQAFDWKSCTCQS